MKITPAAIARIALAIAAIPLIGALVSAFFVACIAVAVVSFIVSWLNEKDHKLNWTVFGATWALIKSVVTQVITWVKAPAEIAKLVTTFEADFNLFKKLD